MKFFQTKQNKISKGFMMIEIVVAVSIITVSFVAAMSVAQGSVYVARQSLHNTQASYLLEEGAEAVRIYRDNTWTNISGMNVGTTYYPYFNSGTWTFPTSATNTAVDIFTRSVVLSAVNRDANANITNSGGTLDTGTKLATITVAWMEGSVNKTKTLSFYIANIF
ncbi:MAG: hypothetical protein NT068_01495 [Candidatus Nomurabacteria bacterium]|nr:hypothetical protein [Candidatus Nomurabacteria bacterium]